MRWLIASMVLVGLASCGSEEDERATRTRQCEALRAHVVDLRLETATGVDVKRHREGMIAALGEQFVARCREMPREEIRCALAATDSESVVECSR